MAREVRQQIVQEHLQLANKQLSRLVAESTGPRGILTLSKPPAYINTVPKFSRAEDSTGSRDAHRIST